MQLLHPSRLRTTTRDLTKRSFSSEIAGLRDENEKLKEKLLDIRNLLETETKVRQQLENELEALNVKYCDVNNQLVQCMNQADASKKEAEAYAQGIRRVFKLTDELQGRMQTHPVIQRLNNQWSGTQILSD